MKATRITKKNGKIETAQVEVPEPVYSVRIRPEIYETCVILAAKDDRSATSYINRVLEQHLANQVQ